MSIIIPNDGQNTSTPPVDMTDADYLACRFNVGYAVGEHAAWFERCHPGAPTPKMRRQTKGRHDRDALYMAECLGWHLGLEDARATLLAGGVV